MSAAHHAHRPGRSPSKAPRAPGAVGLLPVLALLLATLLGPMGPGGATAAPGHPAASSFVLAITQSSSIPEDGNFTVRMQVADPSAVHFVYYSFCQLTSPVCYQPPITMKLQDTDWFVGTTQPMTTYHGMNPGVVAGYNISIQLNNGTNFTEPTLPNDFTNLQLNTSVSGEYMFVMQVAPLVFTLQGTITDAATGSPLPGATVALTPGTNTTTTSSTGAYSFANLPNGTYHLSVSHAGYTAQSSTVEIHGAPAPQNFQLSNGTGGSTNPSGGNTGSHGSSSIPGWAIYALAGSVAAVVIVAVALIALWRGKRGVP